MPGVWLLNSATAQGPAGLINANHTSFPKLRPDLIVPLLPSITPAGMASVQRIVPGKRTQRTADQGNAAQSLSRFVKASMISSIVIAPS